MQRERIRLPPTNWRPRPPTWREKCEILIRQSGKCAITNKKLRGLTFTIFDHRPPLHEREWNPNTEDTIPSGTDINFIRAVDVDADKPVTSADQTRMNKTDRIRDGEDAHIQALNDKAAGKPRRKGSIQSRGFGKRHRPMRGRSSFRG